MLSVAGPDVERVHVSSTIRAPRRGHARSVQRALGLAASIAIALATAAPRGSAQSGSVPAILAGAYEYPQPPEHGRALVVAAIEPHLAEVSPLLRGTVREQLHARIAIPRRITVALDGSIVSVTYEGERSTTIATPLGGSTAITRADGAEVRQGLAGGWLEQTFTGPNGTLRVLLSTEADGRTLHADGSARSDRLRAPIAVRLDYARVAR